MIYHTSSQFWYTARFGWLVWKLRPKYDRVVVHMNPEYVILAGLDWRLMGKKIYFWYNHPKKDWRFRLAAFLADTIFYTSPYAAPASMPHALRMPAGIDTEIFKPQTVPRKRHALYMQGRITPSKHVDSALAAFRIVQKQIPDATLTLVGPEDKAYGESLRRDFADVIGAVTFAGPKPNRETPVLYSAHALSINLADDGHYDKSVLESLACETPVIVSSKAFSDIVPREWVTLRTPEHLAALIQKLSDLPHTTYCSLGKEVRDRVIANESLTILTEKLAETLGAARYTR